MKAIRAFVVLFALAVAANALPACYWPTYDNTVRAWGPVVNLYTAPGFVAFVVQSWSTGEQIRYDCRNSSASSLGCDLVHVGDSILISGHAEDVLTCAWDGIGNILVPNVIYRCAGSTAGTCLQLTPCL